VVGCWLREPVEEIVFSFGGVAAAIRIEALSHGSCTSPNMSRMKRPSPIVESDMRDATAKLSSASRRRPALW